MEIIGNKKNRVFLDKVVKSKNIIQAYLFIGKEGIGKKLIAEEFAKKILCFELSGNDNCKSCIRFESKNHPDFSLLNEESTTIKINDVRELIDRVIEKPILSERKVYIINDADKMTKEAQNCLLKTLEEPQDYAVIILIADNENMILNTIKSRCTRILFDSLTNEKINDLLKQKGYNNSITENMYNLFGGSIGKAEKMIQKKEIYDSVDRLLMKIGTTNKLDFYLEGKQIYIKDEIQGILEYLIVSLYNLGRKNQNYLNCVNIVQETINKINSNCNFDMCLDNMLWKIWEEVNEKNNRS
ncbi:MAG: DNA polymerase III subunit delta' [Clostridia bacterium]|nr:DNA polymerase III subunit delta' [Clostridia bacterium]